MEKQQMKISVRNLVEFILREGNIDSRRGTKAADKEAMLAGGRMHRKIQGRMGSEYQAEVPLKRTVERDGYDLVLEGRADGIISVGEEITIDEIKGVYRDVALLEQPEKLHMAQAKCYACIYGEEKGLESIQVQMTYVNLETEEIRRFKESFLLEELKEWLDHLLEEYGKWTDFSYEWQGIRDTSIRNLEFPFPYREGQRELAVSVYRTINRKKRLFIQAPTGVGKTISTLFPSVKAVGEGLGDKIFYLTAKTVTAQAAKDAFEIMETQGMRLKRVFLTAKEKLCPLGTAECNPEVCPYACGHYDRINEAVFTFLQECDEGSRETLLVYAERFQVCPFEFALDVSLWTDAVVGDYNYAFSPNVRLKRFFGEGMKGGYLFLIDEAHNLVERAREMFSAELCKEDFLEMKRKAKPYSKKLVRELERCNKYLLMKKRECEDYEIQTDISEFLLHLLRLTGVIENLLEEDRVPELAEELREFYFQVYQFLNISERVDESYVTYTWHSGDGRFHIREFCIDPAKNLRECLDKGNSVVFFSATLLPVNYYKELLSGDLEDYGVYVHSPFDVHRRALLIGKDISSRYTRRNAEEFRKTAEYIRQITGGKKGNYLVFFPSYTYMQQVYEVFREMDDADHPVECILQTGGMNEEKQEAFLARFETEQKDTLVGFCVMGGIFSEGIDLKEDRLIGSIVVGTGLPMVCREREILRSYYEEKHGNGFEFAYLYPGMNKVQQAAGRVIRTEKDRGIIALLDERFLNYSYQKIFPAEWQEYQVCTKESVGNCVRAFWEESVSSLTEE